MNGGNSVQCRPRYRLLTEDQIEAFHRATLEILDTRGVMVQHEEGQQLLADAGCRRLDGEEFSIPGWLVEECIRSAPSRLTIYDRRGEEAMRLGGRHIHFGLGTDLISTVDLETGEVRDSVLQDVVNAARVADSCQDIDFIASFALPHDVPTNTMYIQCVKAQLENSTKPIFFTAAGKEDLSVIIAMAGVVAGGEVLRREKPFLIHYSEPTPPLRHSHGAVSKLLLCAEEQVPICYTPAAMLGGSAPVTLAGGIVQANAEALSGLVLHQLKRKGAPIISGLALPPLDMRTSICSYGAPELQLTNSAFSELYESYDLPRWSTVGADSHALDAQAALEHAISTLLSALDGANLIHDAGYLGQGLLGNPAAILMSDEIISFVKRVLRGFEMTPETLALQAMREIGPGGDYLGADHTYQHFRAEQWFPRHLNRDEPETWRAKGGRTYGEVLTQAAREVLGSHQPDPLPANVLEKLDEMAAHAEHTLGAVEFTA